MTAVSISSTRGASPLQPLSHTIATSAPTASFDFEVRYNLLDQNGAALTKNDLVLWLRGVVSGLDSATFYQQANGAANFTGPQL